ncbi:MAG TPA: hypothetical protein VE871_14125 [Longimicrobium sp.]|nr:hypothetical protein [Longimicrobium sp.]
MIVQADSRLRRSVAFLLLALTGLFFAPRPADAAESIRCIGYYGDQCKEFKVCGGIGIRVCHFEYSYWNY